MCIPNFCCTFARKCVQNDKVMKKILFTIVVMMATIGPVMAAVPLDNELKAALPSGEFFLPAPPEVGSYLWKDDSVTYFEFRAAARHFDEEKQEYWDSAWAKMNEQYYFLLYRLSADSVMDAPFLTDVSWSKGSNGKYTVDYTRNEDFPEINALEQLCESMKTANTSNLWRTRPRPFYYFGDWYNGKLYAPLTENNDSYPSGHGYFAGLFGMCLLYIDPDNALVIHQMVDEWLNCRLLLGAHWKSDLWAGKTLGAMAFAIAMNFDSFREQLEAAKAELEAYRAAQSVSTDPESNSAPARATTKSISNGTLLIDRSGTQYNASGAIVK